MFDGDLDALDLGSRRKTTVWIATAAPTPTTKPQRKGGGRCRKNTKELKGGCARQNSGSSSELSSTDDVQALREEHAKCEDVLCLDAEIEDGPIEYKQKLNNPNPTRFQQLVGKGMILCVHDDGYCLGLNPDDLEASLSVVRKMADVLKASIQIQEYLPGRPGRQCAIVEIKSSVNENITSVDLRIAVAGTIDSGKSTLIAVLTHGSGGRPLLDNGLGSARTNILKHKHEIESGRTSSISEQLLGYDSEGRVLNYAGVSSFTPFEIGTTASRQIHFIDMGGHEKYLKTAFYGVGRITREQLGVAFALDIPAAVVLTMTDLASDAQIKAIYEKLENLMQSAGRALSRHLGVNFQDFEKAETISGFKQPSRIGLWRGQLPFSIPIFKVSNVTGDGLPVLHSFLRWLEPMSITQTDSAGSSASETGLSDADEDENGHPCFIVDQTFDLQSVGMVVSGTAVDGDITVGQELNLGPDNLGKFVPVTVGSIQRSQVPVKTVKSGQTATLAVTANQDSSQSDGASGKHDPEGHKCIQRDAGGRGAEHNNVNMDESYRIHGQMPLGLESTTPPRSPSSSLKGRVLLDAAISMTTTREFESIIILLGGHWPARGLLSAKWPLSEDELDSMQSASDSVLSRKCSKKRSVFSTTIHMGNIRQTAHITSMEELEAGKSKGYREHGTLPASLLAAAAVVNAGQTQDVETTVARIVFRFANRSEWVREGARFIARDRSEGGNLSGLGVVVQNIHFQD